MKEKTIPQLKKLLWKDFSRYIRLRDCLATTGTTTHGKCVTCKKVYTLKELQAGHFIPGRANAYLFDPRQVFAQCYSCNMHKAGDWPNYHEFMVKKYGESIVDRMMKQRHEIVKFTKDWLIQQRLWIKDEINDMLMNDVDESIDDISDDGLPF